MDEAHLDNACGGLNPTWGTWRKFLKTKTFHFNFKGYDVYNAANCWYLVDKDGFVFSGIYGFHIYKYLADLTGSDMFEIRTIFADDWEGMMPMNLKNQE